MLEKTLESPLDCKEIQPIHSEGDQSWNFFGSNRAKAETPVLWPPHAKTWLIGKDSDAGRDWVQEEKGMTEDEMAGWHHWLNGCESEWSPGVGDRQGGLACCDSWGHKESDMTEWLNWTEWKLMREFVSLLWFWFWRGHGPRLSTDRPLVPMMVLVHSNKFTHLYLPILELIWTPAKAKMICQWMGKLLKHRMWVTKKTEWSL